MGLWIRMLICQTKKIMSVHASKQTSANHKAHAAACASAMCMRRCETSKGNSVSVSEWLFCFIFLAEKTKGAGCGLLSDHRNALAELLNLETFFDLHAPCDSLIPTYNDFPRTRRHLRSMKLIVFLLDQLNLWLKYLARTMNNLTNKLDALKISIRTCSHPSELGST
jgi:hypothetical protein